MRAKEARKISIVDYLSRENLKPAKAREGGRELWYSSPLRNGDSTPSFKVDTGLNLWYDHGLGQGGNVIDLVCALKNFSVAQALAELESTGLAVPQYKRTDAPRLFDRTVTGETQNTLPSSTAAVAGGQTSLQRNNRASSIFTVTREVKISHIALTQYLESRSLDIDIAVTYLKQIHFKPDNGVGNFFALGFPCGDGFDVRSAVFKGFVGSTKQISIVPGLDAKRERVAIFEGWPDFLSFLTYHKCARANLDCIILHSTSLWRQAVEAIHSVEYGVVHLLLDNDEAGHAASLHIADKIQQDRMVSVTDHARTYDQYDDLNDWLVNQEPS